MFETCDMKESTENLMGFNGRNEGFLVLKISQKKDEGGRIRVYVNPWS